MNTMLADSATRRETRLDPTVVTPIIIGVLSIALFASSFLTDPIGIMGVIAIDLVAAVLAMVGTSWLQRRAGQPVSAADQTAAAEAQAVVEALSREQAMIEFDVKGNILNANENFLTAMGYRRDEVVGRHHSMFVSPEDVKGKDYTDLWDGLRRGSFQTGEFGRLNKNGQRIWIQATYHPILGPDGTPFKVIKFARDVTERVEANLKRDVEALENARVRTALDTCGTNIMVADEDLNIVYTNRTMMDFLAEAEADMREDLPTFRAREVMGANIDTFHKDPSHQRAILRDLAERRDVDLTLGGRQFRLVVSPVHNSDGTRIGTVVEWKDETQARATAAEIATREQEALRLRIALDCSQANVMLADENLDIVFANRSVVSLLKAAESDIRKDLPQFDAGTILGTNIDHFHKDPRHQRTMLSNLTSPREVGLELGGRILQLQVSPVIDNEGVRIGTVVEWQDQTAEKAIESEINDIVSSVVAGDFSKRVPLEGKEGFMLNLASAMNDLCARTGAAVDDTVSMVSTLAGGDLTRQMDGHYEGVFETLKNDANRMASALGEIVGEIKHAATEVSNAATEINAGTTDLSQRTEQQASSLEETAAAMQEIATTVKQNADSATQANQLAMGAREAASRGGSVVGEAVQAMADIESSSTKISEIITVIDEIAFQTNLLALNAAVEAARAGDAGRGFAVVASEVRNLAQRSSQAAKDIKDLISHSTDQVAGGVALVNRTGEALEQILGSIKGVADIVSEISAASHEQATGIDQINTAIASMDQMTQQNSALVEENAAAAKNMADQSLAMQRRVDFFTLKEGEEAITTQTVNLVETKADDTKTVMHPSAPKPASAVKQMQSALAVAVQDDPDWKEF